MNIIWFWVLSGMLSAYALLDGYDLGVGALHLWISRADEERRAALNAIGPVWNGNEVWLIAAGGMLAVSFPRVYAAGFSGFYLALMLLLWLLILRGISIEFRSQVDHPLWRDFWDAGFSLGSLLVAFLLGVALGNILRGLPLGPDGYFQGTFALLLNPYSLLTGIFAGVTLAWHGANYLRVKTEGQVLQRSRTASATLFWVTLILALAATGSTFVVRPHAGLNFRAHPEGYAFPLLAVAGLSSGFVWCGTERDRAALWSSTAVIAGLLGSAALTVYPSLLTSTLNSSYSLTIYNAASSPRALRDSLLANLAGMGAVIVYMAYVHRTFSGKVRHRDHGY